MQALHTRAAKGQKSVQDTARADAIVSRLSQLEFSDQDLRKSTVAQLQAMQGAGLTNPASHREWAEGSGDAIGSSRLAFTGLTAANLASKISMLKASVEEAKAAVAVAKSEAQAVAKARVENNLYREAEVIPRPQSLSVVQTRDWYNGKIQMIEQFEMKMREEGAAAKQIFEVTTAMRNEVKLQARQFMRDQALAESLPSPMSPADVLKKYHGDYEAAIAASKRTNAKVNKQVEALREKETSK